MKPKLKLRKITEFRCVVCGDLKTRGVIVQSKKSKYVRKVCGKAVCVDWGQK